MICKTFKAIAWILLAATLSPAFSDEGMQQRTRRTLSQATQTVAPSAVDLNTLKPTDAQRQHSNEVVRRAGQDLAKPGIPDVQPQTQTPIDLAAMVRKLSGSVPDDVKTRPSGPLVFVSLSMPSASLARLSQDAKKINATLVLRGMVDASLRKTAEALQAYSRQGVNLVIDPQAFKRYNVAVVPSFVVDLADVQSSCQSAGACSSLRSIVVEGDVSLSHAMRGVQAHATGRVKAAASQYIKVLEG